MKKNVDYFIYNYFLYIHKLSSNRGSNRKPNRTTTLCLVGLSTLNVLDQIAIFSNRCYRFGLNMMLKPIQTDPRTPLIGATLFLKYTVGIFFLCLFEDFS